MGDGGGYKPGGGRPPGSKATVHANRIKAKTVAEHVIVETRAKGELPTNSWPGLLGEMIDGYQPTFKRAPRGSIRCSSLFRTEACANRTENRSVIPGCCERSTTI